MAEPITAQNLMKPSFLRLGSNHTLQEAASLFLNARAEGNEPQVLVILKSDGSLAGVLTARYLLRALARGNGGTQPAPAETATGGADLLALLPERLETKVSQAMNVDVPVASPRDRLPHIIRVIVEKRLDCLPVVEDNRVLGIVYPSDAFAAAARLALASHGEPMRPSQS